MNRTLTAGILGTLLCAGCASGPSVPIRTLIVTGDDVDVHKWQETAPALARLFVDSGKFRVTQCDDTKILGSPDALKLYDLIVLDYYNAHQPTIPDEAKANLVEFVKGGKGLVTVHLSSAAFAEWDEFHKMTGRYWKMQTSGHGPRGPFKAVIADKEDPITRGLSDFEANDELYAKLQGDEPIHVLVTADSDFSHKTEPLAFTVQYGKGRVYHHAFGHDVKAIREPATVAKLFVRGAEWAATGKVTPDK